MKIIVAHYKFYVQGGPERYMFKFIELAESHGVQVIPFSVDYPENVNTKYSSYFVRPTAEKAEYGKGKLSLMKIIKDLHYQYHNNEAYTKLKRLMQDEKPDLLYCLIPGMLSSDIFKAAVDSNVPIMLRLSDFRLICGCNVLLRDGQICEECIHGDYKQMVKHKCVRNSFVFSLIRKSELAYARKKHTYQYVDAVIAPPKFTADKFVESGFFPENIVFNNPTFLDCSKICMQESHENYVLCLGRFSPEKGFIYVIEAMQYLKDIPVKVAVTGDKDSSPKELKDAIEKYSLEDKVEFVGFLRGKDLEDITRNSMCVAAPAIWYENLPNVVLEAYSYGKPVIASNLGSLAEIVEDGKTGLLFETKNPRHIADCIRKLYEEPEYCSELGRNARKKCETDFSPEAHWDKFMHIYNGIKKAKALKERIS